MFNSKKKRTIATICDSFTAELEAVAHEADVEADRQHQIATEAYKKAEAANQEFTNANTAIDRIREMFGVETSEA